MIKQLSKEEAKKTLKTLKYRIIYYYDHVDANANINDEVDFDNIYEAFFFNEKEYLHIYTSDKLVFEYINSEDIRKEFYETFGEGKSKENQWCIDETQILENKYKPYTKLKVKKILDLDKDSQYYIKYVVPVELVRGDR